MNEWMFTSKKKKNVLRSDKKNVQSRLLSADFRLCMLKEECLPLFPIVDEQGWRVSCRVAVSFPLSFRPFGVELQIDCPMVYWSVLSWPWTAMLLLFYSTVFISKCVMASVRLCARTSNSFRTSQTSLSTFTCLPPFVTSQRQNKGGLTLSHALLTLRIGLSKPCFSF